MIRLGVIGLGTIFAVQRRALAGMEERYRITAVCDILPEKRESFEASLQEDWTDEKPAIYCESAELFEDPNVDAVLIATPPASHYVLAMEGLAHGKHILLEKPAVLSMVLLEAMYTAAAANRRLLHIAYHASFARDLEWFLRHAGELAPGDITGIECGFYDPYMENGRILPRKRPLGGCFIDSGVNALSVCARLADLTDFRLISKNERKDRHGPGLVYHADHVFGNGNCRAVIHTGWDLGINQKTTTLSFAGSEKRLLLDHSGQSVFLLSGENRELLYSYSATERLMTHYIGVFSDFEKAYLTSAANREVSVIIHRLLLA